MKITKKIWALVLAIVMALALAVPASAVSITITHDDSYGEGSGDGNTYKYYKVFSASYESNTSTGGGSSAGVPGDVGASAKNASYTASSTVANKLGSWATPVYYTAEDTIPEGKQVGDLKSGGWTPVNGNSWFELTPIAGTTNYSVKWIGAEDPDAAAVQQAAAWLFDNNVYEGTDGTAMTPTSTGWTATGLDAGYYLISGATGKNLVAATTDINIKEKNTYPPLDKTQKDEDTQELGNADVKVAVGDDIDYQVKVTIPETAKVGDEILVWDKASEGLTYKTGSLQITDSGVTVADPVSGDVDSSWAWSKVIKVTKAADLGKVVLFNFKMTVNDQALVDPGKKNESGLKYGHNDGTKTTWTYESKPDEVKYIIYFAGIHKIDATDKSDLDNVEFTLKEGTSEFTVKLVNGVYVPATGEGASSTVKTDTNGLIKIRGLDGDKTYTLTETKNPHDGYNMLAAPVTLTLKVDTITTGKYDVATTFEAGKDYYTKEGDTYSKVEGLTEETFNNAPEGTTYFTYDETTTTSTFAANDTWDVVENEKGNVLPSTGGIGTKIFYTMGAVLVIGAGVVLVSRKRAGE